MQSAAKPISGMAASIFLKLSVLILLKYGPAQRISLLELKHGIQFRILAMPASASEIYSIENYHFMKPWLAGSSE